MKYEVLADGRAVHSKKFSLRNWLIAICTMTTTVIAVIYFTDKLSNETPQIVSALSITAETEKPAEEGTVKNIRAELEVRNTGKSPIKLQPRNNLHYFNANIQEGGNIPMRLVDSQGEQYRTPPLLKPGEAATYVSWYSPRDAWLSPYNEYVSLIMNEEDVFAARVPVPKDADKVQKHFFDSSSEITPHFGRMEFDPVEMVLVN